MHFYCLYFLKDVKLTEDSTEMINRNRGLEEKKRLVEKDVLISILKQHRRQKIPGAKELCTLKGQAQ